MRVEKQPFPLCELKGSWQEMGLQYGQDMKAEIAHMANWWEQVLAEHHPDLIPRKGLMGAITMYEYELEAYAPQWIEFMKATAEGAGLPYERVLWINVASNLLEAPEWAMKVKGGCTSLAVEPERTVEGKTIIAQNLDWHNELKVVALHMEPADAPKVLAFTFAGALPQLGVNENGYAQVINTIAQPATQAGVPMNAVCAEGLFGKTMGAAIERVTMCKRGMSFNHLFAHKDGSMLDVETCIDALGFVEERNGRIVHANHFLTNWLQRTDMFKAAADTFIRQRRAEKILDGAAQVSIDTVKEVLTDHHGDPTHAICCHPDPALKFTQTWSTVLSVIIVPEDGTVLATHNPCQNDYAEYRL